MEILSASLCQLSDFSPSLLNSLAVSVGPLNVTRLEFKNMYPGHFNLLQHSSQAKQWLASQRGQDGMNWHKWQNTR